MKKVFTCLLTVSLLIAFGGCAQIEAPFDYLHSSDSIQKIEIVEVQQMTNDGFALTVLHVIDDIDAFIEDFESVTCYRHFTDPLRVDEGDIAIKIIYNNGDYELVTQDGKSTFYKGEFRCHKGYRTFDEEQFQALLDKYLNDTN